MRVVVVTGTTTGIGKTITSAAVVSLLRSGGYRVTMVKPAQTGTDEDEPSDAVTVSRLSGCADVTEIVTLADPLAPDSAARLRQVSIPPVRDVARTALERITGRDVAVVEGAGGVLVRLDTAGGTLVDLADEIAAAGHSIGFLVVTGLQLGTLNHTELTVDLLRRRGFEPAGLVLGAVPSHPSLAERTNLADLPRVTGLAVLASIPAGAGTLAPADFQRRSRAWFDPAAIDRLIGRPSPEAATTSS